MDLLNKYNPQKMFEFEEKERPYVNLDDLVKEFGINAIHTVRAIFINTKSKYGNAPVVITDNYQVNFPQHLTETCEQMKTDGELVDMVNDGRVGFRIYQYNGRNGTGYSVTWEEV